MDCTKNHIFLTTKNSDNLFSKWDPCFSFHRKFDSWLTSTMCLPHPQYMQLEELKVINTQVLDFLKYYFTENLCVHMSSLLNSSLWCYSKNKLIVCFCTFTADPLIWFSASLYESLHSKRDKSLRHLKTAAIRKLIFISSW